MPKLVAKRDAAIAGSLRTFRKTDHPAGIHLVRQQPDA
jgi:hypothetical protein